MDNNHILHLLKTATGKDILEIAKELEELLGSDFNKLDDDIQVFIGREFIHRLEHKRKFDGKP